MKLTTPNELIVAGADIISLTELSLILLFGLAACAIAVMLNSSSRGN